MANTPATPGASASNRLDRCLRVLLVPSVGLVLAAVLLPSRTLSWLRGKFSVIGDVLNWVERIDTPIDLTHLLLFFWVALLLGVLRRQSSWWRAAAILLGLSVASELVQYLVPGRHPLLTDVFDDWLGSALGIILAIAFTLPSRFGTSARGPAAEDDGPTREVLAGVLRGKLPQDLPDVSGIQASWVRVARSEAVVALAHRRLEDLLPHGAAWDSIRASLAPAAKLEAARSLAHTVECRRILDLLGSAGITALVLKGTALSQWLYDAPYLRQSGDIDLLFRSRSDVECAIAILCREGYGAPVTAIPGDLVGYELVCVDMRADAVGFEVDLHWRLCNTPLFAKKLRWSELWGASIALPALGQWARGLGPIHALVHACLHRANELQFGDGDQLRWLQDIKLLAQSLDGEQWGRLTSLAKERGVSGPCWHALRAAEGWLDASIPRDAMDSLADAAGREWLDVERMQNWAYAQWAAAKSLPDWRLRLRWLRQRLLPDPDSLRDSQGHRGWIWMPVILWHRAKSGLRRIRDAP